ncbi:MAG: hypothetical protein WD025_03965 [Bacteriovoracaceae bacterium]
MKPNISKAQRVKDVRRVLAQFGIDIQQLHLSVQSNSIDLAGVLLKYDGSELSSGEVTALVNSLSSFGFLSTSLANWNLTNGEIVKLEWA